MQETSTSFLSLIYLFFLFLFVFPKKRGQIVRIRPRFLFSVRTEIVVIVRFKHGIVLEVLDGRFAFNKRKQNMWDVEGAVPYENRLHEKCGKLFLSRSISLSKTVTSPLFRGTYGVIVENSVVQWSYKGNYRKGWTA